jgi:hypothetical protein
MKPPMTLRRLESFFLICFELGGAHRLVQLGDDGVHVDLGEHVADGLGAHLGDEGVGAVFVDRLLVLGLGEELLELERGLARVRHHVVLVVDDALERAGGHVEQEAEAARHALEEPDVGDGDGELDVAHALAADAGDGDLDAAAVADDVLVLDALVLSAGALVVAHRAEDLLAEKTARLGLERAVVDRLGVLDLALGPRADGLRRGDGDGDAVELVLIGPEDGPDFFAGVFSAHWRMMLPVDWFSD